MNVKLLYIVGHCMVEIIKSLDNICIQMIGVGLFSIIATGFLVDWLLEFMGIKSNSILGKIIRSVVQEPLENILNLASNK